MRAFTEASPLVPKFAYEAANPEGGIARGVVEAPSRSAAVERILARGATPVSLKEHADGAAPAHGPAFSIGDLLPRMFAASDRLAIVRELATLLRAGLSVERALVVMQELARSPRLKATLSRLTDALRGGQPLSAAMAAADEIFPESMRKLVAAGEASGRLAEVMARLSASLSRTKGLRDRAVSAMIYPALLTVVMISVLIMIFTVVLPRLEPLFEQAGKALPWPAAVLLAVSHVLKDYGLVIVALLIAGVAGLIWLLRQAEVRLALDRWQLRTRLLLKLPLRYQTAQFCRNLGMLLDGGLPLNRALEATQAAVANRFMRASLTGVLDAVRQGASLKAAMARADIFPPLALEFAAVGEETGRLATMLTEAADIFDAEVQTRLDQLSALLLPVVTIVLGLFVAAIMTGVVTGILAANDLAV